MSRRSIPRTPKKVKRVAKSKPRKKSPAKRAKAATKKRDSKAKKPKRIRVSKPAKSKSAKPVKKTVKRKPTKKTAKRKSMNIHTRKPAKKTVKKPAKKKAPRKTKRERDLENTVSALRKMIPQALMHSIVTEAQPPEFGPLEDRVTKEEVESVNRILREDLAPEPDSEHDFIPIQPSILDNMAPGTQAAITRVKLYGIRLRNLSPEALAYWVEHKRAARIIHDVTSIWDEGGNEREYMEGLAEREGKRTRSVYTDLLSPGDLEDIFAEPAAE